ncbi:MAG: DUF402 domain-containing protein [Anaerolineales bacterium]|jgi:hypothetical protein
MNKVVVLKLNLDNEVTWSYEGIILEKSQGYIKLEAYFDRDDTDLNGLSLARGDRFIETYFKDRWYNIFEIYDRENDQLKGWYCNVCTPAKINNDYISYTDLALDLIVFPNGRQIVLDQDEFNDLPLSEEIRSEAESALEELKTHFNQYI